jgi:hypothetical protein
MTEAHRELLFGEDPDTRFCNRFGGYNENDEPLFAFAVCDCGQGWRRWDNEHWLCRKGDPDKPWGKPETTTDYLVNLLEPAERKNGRMVMEIMNTVLPRHPHYQRSARKTAAFVVDLAAECARRMRGEDIPITTKLIELFRRTLLQGQRENTKCGRR